MEKAETHSATRSGRAPVQVRVIIQGGEMDDMKRKRLEAAGWKVGSVREFLGLSDEEHTCVETRLSRGGASVRPEGIAEPEGGLYD